MQFMKRMACLLVFASMFISVSDQRLECWADVRWSVRNVEVRVDMRWACSIFCCSVSICLSTSFWFCRFWFMVIGLRCYTFFCISSSLYGGRSGCASGVN